MADQAIPVMGFETTETDEQIIEHLQTEGNNTPANISEAIGEPKHAVHRRLQLLEAAGVVENIGRGVYRFEGQEDSER